MFDLFAYAANGFLLGSAIGLVVWLVAVCVLAVRRCTSLARRRVTTRASAEEVLRRKAANDDPMPRIENLELCRGADGIHTFGRRTT